MDPKDQESDTDNDTGQEESDPGETVKGKAETDKLNALAPTQELDKINTPAAVPPAFNRPNKPDVVPRTQELPRNAETGPSSQLAVDNPGGESWASYFQKKLEGFKKWVCGGQSTVDDVQDVYQKVKPVATVIKEQIAMKKI